MFWPEFVELPFMPSGPLLEDVPLAVAEFPRSPLLLFEFALITTASTRETPYRRGRDAFCSYS
jgi:hypothetical protein